MLKRKIIIIFILIICLISECLLVFANAEGILNAGDTVCFGTYEQNNDTSDGAEVIKWRVLETDGDTATLISCWILDASPYHNKGGDTTWENCYLRDWLNAYFYETAFSDEEKMHIKDSEVAAEPNPKYDTDCGNDTVDKVYLLSYEEARAYFDYSVSGAERYEATDEVVHPDLMAFFTPFALAKGAYVQDKYNSGVWWLRTQGITGGDTCNVAWTGVVGSYGHYVTMSSYGVRPVIKVDLSALQPAEADIYPGYTAAGGDESSAETSESIETQSSEETSAEQSSAVSEESALESSDEISADESSEPSSEDASSANASSEGTSSDEKDKLEDSGKTDNKFKLIGILVCFLAALLIIKIVYNNIQRKKKY